MVIHGGDIYAYNKNVLDFSSNISPLGLPQAVYEAGCKALKHSAVYPDRYCSSLVSALAESEAVSPQNIICGNGAAELIYNIVLALKPQNALITAPTFSEYAAACATVGTKVNYHFLYEKNNFTLTDSILDDITDKTDIVFICSPNNPTGQCAAAELMDKTAESCAKHNAILVIDECFMPFVKNSEKYTSKPLLNKYNNVVILKAFTKIYAMAGVRLGYAMADKALVSKQAEVRQPWSVSSVAQAMGEAALGCGEIPAQAAEYTEKERLWLLHELRSMGIKCFDSQANFILIKHKKGLKEQLLKQNILIRECADFVGLNDEFYRIAVKTHSENMRFAAALRQAKGTV